MTDKEMIAFRHCMEAQIHYRELAEKHRQFSKGVRVCTSIERTYNEIVEAYMMRSETLTKVDSDK